MSMSQANLEALVQEARDTHSSALVLQQHGETLVDEILDERGDRPVELMSVTKGVLSLLVGRAVTLGYLPDVDVKISDLYPEWRQGRKRDITLRHLITHTSGLQNLPNTTPEIYPSPDFVQLALCAELDAEPGTWLEYNNKAANLICGVLERATGQKADDFARAHLFGPLGITDWSWQRDQAGNPHGMSGLRLRPRDLARLGQLALNGEDLIAAEWLKASTSPATPVYDGIGLLWWLIPAWTRYEITAGHVEHVREAGGSPELVQALSAVQGRWESWNDLQEQLDTHGFVREQLPARTRWIDVQQGPHMGFKHDGWLGQYLILLPEAGLVAVRLMAEDQPGAGQPETLFPHFEERILALAGA